MYLKPISMLRKQMLYFNAILATLIVLVAQNTALTQSTNERLSKNNLLVEREDAPIWYQRRAYYTKWPQIKELPSVGDVPAMKYDFEILIKEVMRKGVLQEGWQKNVLRVKEWIPKNIFGMGLDAYLYRQVFKDGILHICDTRPYMIVAYSSDGKENFLKEPKKSLKKAMSSLFKMELPKHIKLRRDEKTGMLLGYTRFNRSAKSKFPSKGILQTNDTTDIVSSFTLSYTIGERIVVFEFQKFHVPGCILDRRYPLFEPADKKPDKVDVCLMILEKMEDDDPKNIPILIKLLAKTPKLYSDKKRAQFPFEAQKADAAKRKILKKLIACINSISEKNKDSIKLIKEALQARKNIRDLHKDTQIDLLDAISSALHRVNTNEAAKIYQEIIKSEPNKDIRGYLIKNTPDMEDDTVSMQSNFQRLLAVIDNPDKDPGATVAAILNSPPRESAAQQAELICKIIRSSSNDDVKSAGMDILKKWTLEYKSSLFGLEPLVLATLNGTDAYYQSSALNVIKSTGSPANIPMLVNMCTRATEKKNDNLVNDINDAIGSCLGKSRKTDLKEESIVKLLRELSISIATGQKAGAASIPEQNQTVDYSGLEKVSERNAALQRLEKISQAPDTNPKETIMAMNNAQDIEVFEYYSLWGKIYKNTKDVRVKNQIVRTMSMADIREFRKVLQKYLTKNAINDDETIKINAIMALGSIGDAGAIEPIYSIYINSEGIIKETAARNICVLLGWPLEYGKKNNFSKETPQIVNLLRLIK